MVDLFQKSKWKKFLTTKVAWTKSIILKRSVHQKLSKYLKWKSFKGAQARVATSAPHASAIVMRTCKLIERYLITTWDFIHKNKMKSETGFQITIITADFSEPKQIK